METIRTKQNYFIHEYNVDKFSSKLDKINKRAIKLGFPTIDVRNVGEKIVEDKVTGLVNKYIEMEITGDTVPYIDGWRFIAKLETVRGDDNLIFVSPSEELPDTYRHTGSKCEHCNVNRYRKYTYVLKHHNGEYKQVGSSCLKDFLGRDDIHEYAKWMDMVQAFFTGLSDEEKEFSTGSFSMSEVKFDMTYYVRHVAEYISLKGFISGTRAREEGLMSTASLVWEEIFSPLKRKGGVVKEVSEESKELAEKAIEWAKNLDKTKERLSDYEYSLNLSAQENIVDFNTKGIVASIIPAYKYAMNLIEKKKKEKETRKNSQYVGKIKERMTFDLEVLNVNSFGTEFGVTSLHIMKDDNDNIFTWFSSSCELEKGKKYKLKGTIKEHRIYNGEKQTVLTRCKEL